MLHRFVRSLVVLGVLFPAVLWGQLCVLRPNGGEHFLPGDSIVIQWSGLPSRTPVVLRFSSDQGKSWQVIAEGIRDTLYTWLAPAISSHDCLINVRQTEGRSVRPRLLHTLWADSGAVTYVAFSPDGQMLATAGWDRKARLWDVKTGQLLRTIGPGNGSVLQTVFSPDGRLLTTTSLDSTVRTLDILTGVSKPILRQNNFVWAATYLSDGDRFVVSNDNGTVSLIDLQSGDILNEYVLHSEAVRDLVYSAEDGLLISGSADGLAAVSDAETGEVLRRFVHYDSAMVSYIYKYGTDEEWDTVQWEKPVNTVAYLPEKDWLITGGFDGWVKFWDVPSGRLLDSGRYHGGEYVSHLDVSPDGQWMLTVGYDSTLKIIHLQSHNVVGELVSDFGRNVAVEFNVDGTLFAVAHWNKAVTIWRFDVSGSDVSDGSWSIGKPDRQNNPDRTDAQGQY